MRVRFTIEREEDAHNLTRWIDHLQELDGFVAWHARVRLREGREVFGSYGSLPDGRFVVENDFNLDDDPELRGVERRCGWLPHERKLILHPRDIHSLEYVPEGSADFIPN